jgi:hypothetical protein
MLFITLFLSVIFSSFAQENLKIGRSSSYPKTYNEWMNGLLAGNGKLGIIVFGNPLNETTVFNDKEFFIAVFFLI